MAKKRKVRKGTEKESLVTLGNVRLVRPHKDRDEDGLFSIEEGEMKIKLEREFRRFIKRSGGLRKGLEGDKKVMERVGKLQKALKRKELAWDPKIFVPGIDNPTVKGMFIAN